MREDYFKAKTIYDRWRNRGEGRMYLCVLFSMCEGKCPNCGKNMNLNFYNGKSRGGSPHNMATLDHIIPLNTTEKHDKMNLQIMCFECNHNKAGEIEARNSCK